MPRAMAFVANEKALASAWYRSHACRSASRGKNSHLRCSVNLTWSCCQRVQSVCPDLAKHVTQVPTTGERHQLLWCQHDFTHAVMIIALRACCACLTCFAHHAKDLMNCHDPTSALEFTEDGSAEDKTTLVCLAGPPPSEETPSMQVMRCRGATTRLEPVAHCTSTESDKNSCARGTAHVKEHSLT